MVSRIPEATDPQVLIPKASVEVKREDVKKLAKFKPGARLKVLLVGVLVETHLVKAEPESEQKVGDFVLEVKEMQISPAADNEIAELFADEDL